jgi:signal transduction histidine kinase
VPRQATLTKLLALALAIVASLLLWQSANSFRQLRRQLLVSEMHTHGEVVARQLRDAVEVASTSIEVLLGTQDLLQHLKTELRSGASTKQDEKSKNQQTWSRHIDDGSLDPALLGSLLQPFQHVEIFNAAGDYVTGKGKPVSNAEHILRGQQNTVVLFDNPSDQSNQVSIQIYYSRQILIGQNLIGSLLASQLVTLGIPSGSENFSIISSGDLLPIVPQNQVDTSISNDLLLGTLQESREFAGARHVRDRSGAPHVGVVLPLAKVGWSLLISKPQPDIAAFVGEGSWKYHAGVFALASLLGILLRAVNAIDVPLENLRESIRRYTRGELDYRMPVGGNARMHRIGHEMNEMAADLQGLLMSRNALDREVSERAAVQSELERGKKAMLGILTDLTSKKNDLEEAIGIAEAQTARVRALYEIAAHPERPFGAQLLDGLEKGCELVRAEAGAISCVDEDSVGVEWWYAFNGSTIVDGRTELGGTEVQRVMSEGGFLYVSLADVKLSLNSELAFASYMGVPIRVKASSIGSLGFFFKEQLNEAKVESLRDVILALGQWVSGVYERRYIEQELADKVEALDRSNQDLEQFAYVASHDLQEPLRMVGSFAELVKAECHASLDEQGQRWLGFVMDGAQRMQTLVRDLLAYSRTGTKQLTLKSVSLKAVIADVVGNLDLMIRESGAVVEGTENLPTVLADEGLIGLVFQNLVINAIKFRRDNIAPVVKFTYQNRADECIISVKDNGIGIEKEYLERIFVIFQRLHAGSRYPGTGLGLAICKRIIERHNGRIGVESVPGEGTTFFVVLRREEREVRSFNVQTLSTRS